MKRVPRPNVRKRRGRAARRVFSKRLRDRFNTQIRWLFTLTPADRALFVSVFNGAVKVSDRPFRMPLG